MVLGARQVGNTKKLMKFLDRLSSRKAQRLKRLQKAQTPFNLVLFKVIFYFWPYFLVPFGDFIFSRVLKQIQVNQTFKNPLKTLNNL